MEPRGNLCGMFCGSTKILTEEHRFLTFSEQFENMRLNRTMKKPDGNIMLKY